MKEQKTKLLSLLNELKNLHRRFLELERHAAEKYFERKFSPFEFLQMLTQDMNFQWLYPFSVLIADLDAFADEVPLISSEDSKRIRLQIQQTLMLARIQDRYQNHLSNDPEFTILHANFVKSLNDFETKSK